MDISERIATIIKSHNLTNSSFADELGVQRSNISHIISGRSKPGLEFLEKVLLRFPRVNADWLITGKTRAQTTVDIHEENTMKTESPKGVTNKEMSTASGNESNAKEIDYLLIVYKDQSFEKIRQTVD